MKTETLVVQSTQKPPTLAGVPQIGLIFGVMAGCFTLVPFCLFGLFPMGLFAGLISLLITFLIFALKFRKEHHFYTIKALPMKYFRRGKERHLVGGSFPQAGLERLRPGLLHKGEKA